jgi:hypothetical protein
MEVICSNKTMVHIQPTQDYIHIHARVILPVVLYGCETSSLTFMEEHRLRVFENRILRKICGLKMYEVIGENKELYNCILRQVKLQ